MLTEWRRMVTVLDRMAKNLLLARATGKRV